MYLYKYFTEFYYKRMIFLIINLIYSISYFLIFCDYKTNLLFITLLKETLLKSTIFKRLKLRL